MKIVNASNVALNVPIQGTRIQAGREELVFPCKAVLLPPKTPVAVKDDDGLRIIEQWSAQGVTELLPDETVEDAVRRGKQQRLGHLEKQVTMYRNDQGMRKAQGLELLMPGPHLRPILRELKALKAELLTEDPETKELMGNLPTALEVAKMAVVEDPMATELAEMGIHPAQAPIVPQELQGLVDL